MTRCYIGIGSNMGDRRSFIEKAIESMGRAGINVTRVSSIYETDPVSDIPQGKYLNGVAEIETTLKPRDLLDALNEIEESLGRKRLLRNGPRTIDLDILYYGNEVIKEDGLKIPHEKIGEREFVLKGLRELGKALR
ncbi:MAG: 2-amino-4-hydroxy-6-hydroxymethyldihydropteridine diphosphokinase [Candidatus Omnitrophica bacterium]|nr:2-amino-4-hydroxy-6-hydroxymethyldihydropteridine diphosphokinase [Candidatus Omnitrophota bacterium]